MHAQAQSHCTKETRRAVELNELYLQLFEEPRVRCAHRKDVRALVQANFQSPAKVAVHTVNRIEVDHDAAVDSDKRGRIELLAQHLQRRTDQMLAVGGDDRGVLFRRAEIADLMEPSGGR
jgi:hypothetical protein